MSTPLYYLPGQELCSDLAKRKLAIEQVPGLSHLRKAPEITQWWNETQKGPDGKTGSIFTYQPKPFFVDADKNGERSVIACDLDNQVWRDCGRFWIGMWTTDLPSQTRPKPKDLFKDSFFTRYDVPLGDGELWSIPIVPVDLPRTFYKSPDGSRWMRVKRDFLDLIPLAKKYYDMQVLSQPITEELTYAQKMVQNPGSNGDKAAWQSKIVECNERLSKLVPDDIQMAADLILILSKQYYISEEEAVLLELLDGYSMGQVINVCIRDSKALSEQVEALKKSGDIPAAFFST